jgi:hypothetical protein
MTEQKTQLILESLLRGWRLETPPRTSACKAVKRRRQWM